MPRLLPSPTTTWCWPQRKFSPHSPIPRVFASCPRSLRELCVSDLVCATDVSQSAVSHQLRLLRDKNLISVHREGQRAVYSLADDHIKSLIDLALQHASEKE